MISTIIFLFVLLVFAGLLLFVGAILSWFGLLLGAIGFVLTVSSSLFFVTGLFQVKEEERAIIERFGEFHRIAPPGLRWMFPGVDKVRRYVGIWEQPIELFSGKVSLDFKGGGTTGVDEAEARVRIRREEAEDEIPQQVVDQIENAVNEDQEQTIRKNCYLSEYAIEDWESSSRQELENLVRGTLNERRVENVLRYLNWRDIIEATSNFIENLKSWGFEFRKFTLTDYDLDENIQKIRARLFETRKEKEIQKVKKEIAEHVSEKWARELGQTYANTKEIIMQMGNSEEEAKQVAQGSVIKKLAMEADQYNLKDVRAALEGLDIQDLKDLIF